MFWFKKKRKEKYFELNKLFQDKHQIICNWYIKKHLCINNGLQPINDEGKSYQRRMKEFFGDNNYGKLPHSYNLYASVNVYHDEKFDHYPIEKLLELYNKIETFFPEPFYKQSN